MSVAIEIRDAAKRYGRKGQLAVDGVSLEVSAGEIVGVLGPNGAGKTTLLKLLCGLVRPTAGEFRIAGLVAADAREQGKLGALLEEPGFHPFLSARDNLRWLAGLRGLPRDAVEEALAIVKLGDAADRKYREYSLGMRKRAGLASAILGDPEVCVLDEPTNGLDAHGVIDCRDLLRDLRSEGKAVLMSTHVTEDVHELCDRVAVLDRGRLHVVDDTDRLLGAVEATISAEPADRAAGVLGTAFGIEVGRTSDGSLRCPLDSSQIADAVALLTQEGVRVHGVERRPRKLSDLLRGLPVASSAGT